MGDIIDYIKSLPWKEWIAPLITGVLTIVGAVYVQHEKTKIERDSQRVDSATAQTADITERIKALMDGYEHHVESIMADLATTKVELREAMSERDKYRKLYDEFLDKCRKCKETDNAT